MQVESCLGPTKVWAQITAGTLTYSCESDLTKFASFFDGYILSSIKDNVIIYNLTSSCANTATKNVHWDFKNKNDVPLTYTTKYEDFSKYVYECFDETTAGHASCVFSDFIIFENGVCIYYKEKTYTHTATAWGNTNE